MMKVLARYHKISIILYLQEPKQHFRNKNPSSADDTLKFVLIYMEATREPFSYLFINLTQECDPKLKYLSHLFDNNGFVNIS